MLLHAATTSAIFSEIAFVVIPSRVRLINCPIYCILHLRHVKEINIKLKLVVNSKSLSSDCAGESRRLINVFTNFTTFTITIFKAKSPFDRKNFSSH